MAKPAGPAQISNPFSTGGGGHAFETAVAASYLAALLAGHTPRGQSGSVLRVKLQARHQGSLVDDVSVTTDVGEGEYRQVDVQAKSTVHFTRKDKDLHDFLTAAWAEYSGHQSDQPVPRTKMALAFASHAPKLDDLRRLLGQADAARDADDFVHRLNVPEFTSNEQRKLRDLFGAKLTEIAGQPIDEGAVWGFLRHFAVLHFDFGDDGTGSDALLCRALLRSVLASGDDADAGQLFTVLKDIALEGAPEARDFDRDQLRERAIRAGLKLRDREDFAADFHVLRRHREELLALLDDRLCGGVHVPRARVVDQVSAAAQGSPFTAVVGEPGAGKSALLRSLADRLAREGEIIFLDAHGVGERLMAPGSLEHGWREVLRAASASGRWLVIDRLEALQGDDDRQRFVRLLLGHVRALNDELAAPGAQAPPTWRVVLSCREEPWQWLVPLLPPVSEAHSQNRLQAVRVGGFTDDDLAYVETTLPRLRPVLADARLRELLRRPFLLDAFLRCEAEPSLPAPPTFVTETWLMDRVWHGIVRRSEGARQGRGAPSAREDTLIRLAVHAISHPSEWSPETDYDQEALGGLRDIGLVHLRNSRARIAHDAFADWALARALLVAGDEVGDLLVSLREVYSLDRPMHLLALLHLEARRDVGAWLGLVERLRADTRLSARWSRLATAAPLRSEVLDQLTPALTEVYFGGDGQLLDTTFGALCFELTIPDPRMRALTEGMPSEEQEELLDHVRIPVPQAWLPMLRLLLANADAVPEVAMPGFVRALRLWMTQTPSDWPLRREVTRLALSLYPKHAFEWRRREDEP